ncbi:MAG: hypothetical protein K0Q52_134 [Microbacterium sp.]|jgi:hypothetical protein|nr:hypothetical protein [Microbacterium sp.]
MIERCSCNAMIVTLRRRRVLEWRQAHRHDMGEDAQPHVDEARGAETERGWVEHDFHRPTVGFSPNGI